ncbi:hypothetical protein NMG60_11017694 [Bertholletia excelsa]
MYPKLFEGPVRIRMNPMLLERVRSVHTNPRLLQEVDMGMLRMCPILEVAGMGVLHMVPSPIEAVEMRTKVLRLQLLDCDEREHEPERKAVQNPNQKTSEHANRHYHECGRHMINECVNPNPNQNGIVRWKKMNSDGHCSSSSSAFPHRKVM